MARLISEKSFINENILQAETRFNSQYARFLDKAPVFVTYYHINNIESITDNGFQNIEQLLGDNSPLKFNKVDEFPVYGLDPILLDLNDDDEGLTTSYEGELIVLPNTVKPNPNDFFVIDHLGTGFLFVVTTVSYDTIKSNNYYKIGFSIKTIADDATTKIEKQISDEYSCIFTNIGTSEKCIVQNTEYSKLQAYSEMYNRLTETYKILFYNNNTNTFIFNDGTYKIYDKYLNFFINRNELFTQKYSYDTVFLMHEDNSPDLLYKFEKSIYRMIEKCDKSKLPENISYILKLVTDPFSVFTISCIKNVRSIEFTDSNLAFEYIPKNIMDAIHSNVIDETLIQYIPQIIIKYFNNTITDLFEIDIDRVESEYLFEPSFANYVQIPILLFILRVCYIKRMSFK